MPLRLVVGSFGVCGRKVPLSRPVLALIVSLSLAVVEAGSVSAALVEAAIGAVGGSAAGEWQGQAAGRCGIAGAIEGGGGGEAGLVGGAGGLRRLAPGERAVAVVAGARLEGDHSADGAGRGRFARGGVKRQI